MLASVANGGGGVGEHVLGRRMAPRWHAFPHAREQSDPRQRGEMGPSMHASGEGPVDGCTPAWRMGPLMHASVEGGPVDARQRGETAEGCPFATLAWGLMHASVGRWAH